MLSFEHFLDQGVSSDCSVVARVMLRSCRTQPGSPGRWNSQHFPSHLDPLWNSKPRHLMAPAQSVSMPLGLFVWSGPPGNHPQSCQLTWLLCPEVFGLEVSAAAAPIVHITGPYVVSATCSFTLEACHWKICLCFSCCPF